LFKKQTINIYNKHKYAQFGSLGINTNKYKLEKGLSNIGYNNITKLYNYILIENLYKNIYNNRKCITYK